MEWQAYSAIVATCAAIVSLCSAGVSLYALNNWKRQLASQSADKLLSAAVNLQGAYGKYADTLKATVEERAQLFEKVWEAYRELKREAAVASRYAIGPSQMQSINLLQATLTLAHVPRVPTADDVQGLESARGQLSRFVENLRQSLS